MKELIRILVLEDNAADCELATLELRRSGIKFEFKCVTRKKEFENELKHFNADIIIADYNLPDMSALDALKIVKRLKLDTPLILLTGTQSEEVAAECIKAGAEDYILKSSLVRLPSALVNVLQKRNSERERLYAEERLRAVIANTPMILFALDRSGKVTLAEGKGLATLGMTPEMYLGRNIKEINLELREVQESFARALAGETFNRTSSFMGLNFDTHYAPMRDHKGEIVGVLGVAHDITDQMKMVQALKSSEDVYRRVIECVPGGIVQVSKTGAILRANTEAQKFLGLTFDSITKMYVSDFKAKTIWEDFSECEVKDYPVSKCLQTGTAQSAVTMGVYRPDGSLGWAIFSAIPLTDPSTGEASGAVVTFLDISERKRNEEALRTLVYGAGCILWNAHVVRKGENDFDWHYQVFASDVVRKGLRVELAPPGDDRRLWSSRVSPEEQSKMNKVALNALESGARGYQQEFCLELADKSQRWMREEVRIYPVKNGEWNLVGVEVDITELKEAEEARIALERKLLETQKLESLGVLAGGIAHDFNNLLAGILGNASLAALQMPADSPLRPYLSSIEATTQRAADLCKQMLAYAGKGRVSAQLISVNSLIEEMTHLLKVSIGRNILLKFNFGKDLPLIKVDATQIRQIVMNMIINASESIGSGNGAISITTGLMHATKALLSQAHLAPDLPTGQYVFVEVADTGCGMDAETKARIFDPFFTTKFTGRGLGLAAVLGIVRGHKGAISVDSVPGQGTVFKVMLPLLHQSKEVAPVPKSSPDTVIPGGNVLVVEDESQLRALHGNMLEVLGFRAILASDGVEALEFFREKPAEFSAVLLDLTMPRMNGEETLLAMRRIHSDVRVIVMTGHSTQAISRQLGRKIEMLQKPFTPQELQAKLRQVLMT